MVDNRKVLKDNIKLIAHLCDRRFGIIGLILLENDLKPISNIYLI
jgi:hypothetical protein